MTLPERLAAHARDLDASGHDTEATGAADAAIAAHAGASDPHTGYRKESDDHSHATTGAQGGTVAHSALTGLTTGDPHTQYRLEADDHTHASSGVQGGQIAYSALTGTPTVPTAGSTPSTQAFGDSAVGGADATFSKNDHKHAWPALGTTAAAIGTSAGGAATTPSKSDHVHATGAGTPSTQAFADAADTGTGPAASMTDHKHAMPANPVTGHEAAGDPHAGYRLESADHSHATTGLQGGQVAHSALSGITATDHHAAPTAGPDANITVDAAGDAGTASTFARSAHGHRLNTYGSTPAAIGTGAAGTSTTAPARGDHVHATGAGTPSTQAIGDVAATGAGPAAAMTDHKHAMPSFATNAVVLGTAAAAGAATTPMRSNDTIAAFDATVPSTAAFSDAAATGSAAFAARRDHVHGQTALGTTPGASAMGDTQSGGAATTASKNDHRHARSTATEKLFLPAAQAKLDGATAANVGASPDLTGVVAYADGATSGAIWTFMVPADWVSGVITLQPVWSPGSSDATPHTVRWSIVAARAAAGTNVTTAGTTTTFTGASAARTAGVLVYDTATSTTLTPAAAGDLFRFTLRRIGADGADTYVGVVNLLGVIVSYTANT